MATNLARTNGRLAPAGLGERDNVREVFERIRDMMPGAADAPDAVVMAAAQIATAHQLNPFNGEVYVMPTGSRKTQTGQWEKVWSTHVGVKGLRKAARRQAEFMTEFEDLTPEEVKAARRGNYHPEDLGVRCALYRLDVAATCQRIGIPYKPTVAMGYWRKQATQRTENGKRVWKEDNVPETWTPQMVAKKRAEINAIKEAFDLELSVADPSQTGEDETWEVMARHVETFDRDRALPVQGMGYTVDEDGELWAANRTPRNETPGKISDGQLRRLHHLGIQFYGKERWDEERARLVDWVSTGHSSSSKDLLATEAGRLIAGLERKIADAAGAVQSIDGDIPQEMDSEL